MGAALLVGIGTLKGLGVWLFADLGKVVDVVIIGVAEVSEVQMLV